MPQRVLRINVINVDDIEFFVDLGAERLLAAQKQGQQIAVEVKSFVGASEVTEFHLALGQTLNYRLALIGLTHFNET